MKSKLSVKMLLVLPAILFMDYIVMALFGGFSLICGAGNDFYCGIYCSIGKILVVLSGVFFLYLIYPDLKLLIKNHLWHAR